jgi:hypothetical protein
VKRGVDFSQLFVIIEPAEGFFYKEAVMTRKSVLALISMAIIIFVGCGKALSVLAPSEYSNSSNDVVASVRDNWSPYIESMTRAKCQKHIKML